MPLQHTPGPWEREQAQDGEYTGPADNPPGYAGDYYETNNVGWMDRDDGTWHPVADCYHPADAALVSAAPDLLSALREFVAINDRNCNLSPGTWDSAVVMARAAIAKAEGGHP